MAADKGKHREPIYHKSVGQLMDAAGNIVAKYEYSPFGAITAQSGDYADADLQEWRCGCQRDQNAKNGGIGQ